MKCLIVEDNPEMRRLLKWLLHDLTAEITECSDGDEALAAYEAQAPDWVLMDLQMERMDGITATRALMAAYPHAKVIVVTDYDDANLRQAASQAGAIAYLLKENLTELQSVITAAAPGTRTERALNKQG